MMKNKKHGLKMKSRPRKGIFLYSYSTPSNAHGSGSLDFSIKEKFSVGTWSWLTGEAKNILDKKYVTNCTVVGTDVVWLES